MDLKAKQMFFNNEERTSAVRASRRDIEMRKVQARQALGSPERSDS